MTLTLSRQSHTVTEASLLSDIYREDINLCVWQRTLEKTIQATIDTLIVSKPHLQLSLRVQPHTVLESLHREIETTTNISPLLQDITMLVDMFCFLFDLEEAGLRLTVLQEAMCPRFHVDRVPCRLITTYRGIATQWLPQDRVDRSKLGSGNQGLPDTASGIYQNPQHIESLNTGDVALLKGESWNENEGGGIVHRSPQPIHEERRLLMTLDF